VYSAKARSTYQKKKIHIQLLSQYYLILQVFTNQNEQPTVPRKDDLKARMPRLWPPEAFLPSVAGSNPQKPRIFQERGHDFFRNLLQYFPGPKSFSYQYSKWIKAIESSFGELASQRKIPEEF